ncbi:MAG: enoyl-CoA hydratase/isomerase family protein [Deltaproteobacteria bacterium]|nr:enoyl-CoA hydratase/isomerase family protein [Deltaproteobacteria bacterium]
MNQKKSVFPYEMDGKVAVVRFNVPEDPVNTWTQAAMKDFAALMDDLEAKKADIDGIIFISGKPGTFHAGANLKEVAEAEDMKGLDDMVTLLHGYLLRMENMGVPTLGAIHGPCLGGGYEFVLPMTARLATDSRKTVIGLPECTVGLFPGGGGTQRLPRLIGYPALELILQGRMVPPAKALELGMVDRLVPEGADLLAEAKQFMKEIIAGEADLKRPEHDFSDVDAVADMARQAVLKATRGREIPAPMLALKAMHEGLKQTLEEGLKTELKYFFQVNRVPECKGTINTFFLKTRTDKPASMLPRDFEPKPVKKIAMLGFGTMGRGIVIDILRHMQVPVVVKDLHEALEPGKAFVGKILQGMADKGRLKGSVEDRLARIVTVSEWTDDFNDVDLVIEAVFEDPALKAEVYGELCSRVSDDCLIASNTSSIPITALSKDVKNPGRFCGAHFFSPVWLMQLLEIIRTDSTMPETVNNLLNFCAAIRKRPVVCNDYPGFVVNAMLFPYMRRSFELVEEGVPILKVDEAITRFGLPVGPIRLCDEVGLDVLHSVFTKSLGQAPPATLDNVVKAGRLGRKKSGKGFFLEDGSVDPEVMPLIPVSDTPKDYEIEEIQSIFCGGGQPAFGKGRCGQAGRGGHGGHLGHRVPARQGRSHEVVGPDRVDAGALWV